MKKFNVVVKGYLNKVDKLHRVTLVYPDLEAANKRQAKRIVKALNNDVKLKKIKIKEKEL